MFETNVDRRNFLRGSALFAAAIGLTVVAPAAAQEQDHDQQTPNEKKDPFANEEKGKSGEKTYTDKDGREYRICPQLSHTHMRPCLYML